MKAILSTFLILSLNLSVVLGCGTQYADQIPNWKKFVKVIFSYDRTCPMTTYPNECDGPCSDSYTILSFITYTYPCDGDGRCQWDYDDNYCDCVHSEYNQCSKLSKDGENDMYKCATGNCFLAQTGSDNRYWVPGVCYSGPDFCSCGPYIPNCDSNCKGKCGQGTQGANGGEGGDCSFVNGVCTCIDCRKCGEKCKSDCNGNGTPSNKDGNCANFNTSTSACNKCVARCPDPDVEGKPANEICNYQICTTPNPMGRLGRCNPKNCNCELACITGEPCFKDNGKPKGFCDQDGKCSALNDCNTDSCSTAGTNCLKDNKFGECKILVPNGPCTCEPKSCTDGDDCFTDKGEPGTCELGFCSSLCSNRDTCGASCTQYKRKGFCSSSAEFPYCVCLLKNPGDTCFDDAGKQGYYVLNSDEGLECKLPCDQRPTGSCKEGCYEGGFVGTCSGGGSCTNTKCPDTTTDCSNGVCGDRTTECDVNGKCADNSVCVNRIPCLCKCKAQTCTKNSECPLGGKCDTVTFVCVSS